MASIESRHSFTERVVATTAAIMTLGAAAISADTAVGARPKLGKIERVCVPPGTTVHSLTDRGPYLYTGKVFRSRTTVKVREIPNPHQGGVGSVWKMLNAFPGRILLQDNPYDFDNGMNVKKGSCAGVPETPSTTPSDGDVDIVGISDGDDLENGGTTVDDENGDGVIAARTPNGTLSTRIYCTPDTDNGIPMLSGWVKTAPRESIAVPVRASLMNLNVARTNLLAPSIPLDATGYGLVSGRQEIPYTPYYGQPTAQIQLTAVFGGGDNPSLKTSPYELCYGDSSLPISE